MPRTQFIAMALTGTALAATPASAGVLGGGAANCLCQAVQGLTVGTPAKATSIVRGTRGIGQAGLVRVGPHAGGTIGGNVTSSVKSSLSLSVDRSVDRRSGNMKASAGLIGKVHGGAVGAANFNGPGRSVGLAGRSSTQGSINSGAGLAVTGLGTNHAHGLAGNVGGTVNAVHGKAHGSGQLANVSVLNKTGSTGRPAVNIAALNGTGGTSGKIANVSALNKTGTTGRPLVNAAVLNGSAGGTGRLANVAVLNGRHGNGHGNGGLALPNGVQIINGVPCGPDGKPLTGAAATTVMAMIGGNSSHGGGSGNGSSSPAAGNSGNGSASAGSGSSQSGSAVSAGGQSRERDMADRKDLWWPPHYQSYNPDGRLNDH